MLNKCSFNNDWLFLKVGDSAQAKVNLPHDAMIYEKRDSDCINAQNSGFYPGGKYQYEKNWYVPQEYSEKMVILHFEGIYRKSEVRINGELAAKRANGYTEFYVECNKFLKYGKENKITVIADNSETPNSRWYSGSGIYRPVNLIVKDKKNHIAMNGVKVKTLGYVNPSVNVKVAHSGGKVKNKVLYKGEVIAEKEGDDVNIELPDAKLWSDEAPYLYELCVLLYSEKELTDAETLKFGIRTLAWSMDGFYVNGQETKLRGACIHHDNGVLGACAFSDAEDRKVRILKETGFNAIRSAHNPCSDALLKACDKYGMYVIDEYSDIWYKHKLKNDYASDFDEWFKSDLSAMVERGYNHPSIVMYSIGNEIGEVWEEKGVEVTKEMVDICHRLDDTRPVTSGLNLMLSGMDMKGIGVFKQLENAGKQKKKKVSSDFYNTLVNIIGRKMDNQSKKKYCDKATYKHFSNLDISGYNYASVRYKNEPKKYPDRIIVGAETRPPNISENWALVKELKHVIGDFMWTGWDYIGEAGIGVVAYDTEAMGSFFLKKYPYLLAGSGVIDITGMPRPEVWLNKAAWELIGDAPYIGVKPLNHLGKKGLKSMWRLSDAVRSWSWHGYEGKKTEIVVYSNAAKVELKLNGKSLGIKNVKKNEVHFKVKYFPGELSAVNCDSNGNEVGRDILETANETAALKIIPECKTLKANGQDLCYLNIYISDINGVVIPMLDRKISVTLEGAATLQGFGSANPYTEEGFVSSSHDTFYGRALAVIRAGSEAGKVLINVSAEGFETQSIEIDIIA